MDCFSDLCHDGLLMSGQIAKVRAEKPEMRTKEAFTHAVAGWSLLTGRPARTSHPQATLAGIKTFLNLEPHLSAEEQDSWKKSEGGSEEATNAAPPEASPTEAGAASEEDARPNPAGAEEAKLCH